MECLGKGKARKPHEFGVEVGLVVTHKQGFMIGACVFSGDPYDGHALAQRLKQDALASASCFRLCRSSCNWW